MLFTQLDYVLIIYVNYEYSQPEENDSSSQLGTYSFTAYSRTSTRVLAHFP